MTGPVRRLLRHFTLAELLAITLLATLGIASKPVVVAVVRMVTGIVPLPRGAIAGGLYMMWLVMGGLLLRRFGAATLVGLVQALVVALTGMIGGHGPLSLFTYVAPGIAADLALLALRRDRVGVVRALTAGLAANVAGMLLVNVLFYRLGSTPLGVAVGVAAVSGMAGGLLAFLVAGQVRRLAPDLFADTADRRESDVHGSPA